MDDEVGKKDPPELSDFGNKAAIKKLGKLGLSKKGARVYLALLGLGTSRVSEVSHRAGVNRSTTYLVLSELMGRGLVGTTEKGNVRYFEPQPPDRLVHSAKADLEEAEARVAASRQLQVTLDSLYSKTSYRPRVKFLEGLPGIVSAYEDTLTSTETIRAYASIDHMHAALPSYFPAYYRRRARRGIGIRAIFPDTVAARERVASNVEEKREAYLVPKERYDFSYEINIYDNKVTMVSLVEKFAVILESKNLVGALKTMFDLSWEEARRLHEKSARKIGRNGGEKLDSSE